MKAKHIFGIFLLVIMIAIFMGVYYKSLYLDFNKEEVPLENFVVALLDDEFLQIQLQLMEEKLQESPIIAAVQCEDKFMYRYSCVTQKVKVLSTFKGENIREGDLLEVARASTLIAIDEESMVDGKFLINMGFVNEMIPGKTYLLFLDRRLETYDENVNIYIQSDDFVLAPIFCYENILNIPQEAQYALNTYVKYENVKNNEFFIMSEKSNKKIEIMKEKLFQKYNYMN